MLSKLYSITTIWLQCETIDVEVDIARWLSVFSVVWLWDTAVQEAKERVRSAIKNTNLNFPNIRITVNLAPADIRKRWPIYDLAIAVWILISSWQISLWEQFLKETIFAWELALDWNLRHIAWVLPIAIHAKSKWFKRIILPVYDACEAALIQDLEVWWIKDLNEFVMFAEWEKEIIPVKYSFDEIENYIFPDSLNFKHIKWQEHVKRALEICASWSHNILLNGSPGSWKTLMARALQTILPKMTLEESLEVTKIYSVANKLDKPLITTRPFRSAHHTASSVSIVWWWSNLRPWEISLAHRWILFLDEFAEFPQNVLEVLRQPIEDKCITISRSSWSTIFPAQFTLVAAMNPCECWYYNVPNSGKDCTCAPMMISRYQKKISGPLLDRIDLYCDVSPVKFEDLKNYKEWESSEKIKERVQKARDIQTNRFKKISIKSNSEMAHSDIKKFCNIDEKSEKLLEISINKFNLSARSIHRILKVSRTIADLEWNENISFENLAESLQYRQRVWEM